LARPRAKTASTAAGSDGWRLVDRRRRLVRVGRRLGRLALAFERPPSGEQLDGDTRERVPVARRGGRLAACLFRGHVADGPEHRPHLGERVLIGRTGDPEVRDADRLVLGDQQVCRFDVAVDDPARVRTVERTSGLLEPQQRLLGRNGAAFEPVSDRPMPGILHDDERKAVRGLAHVIDRNDVRFAREVRSGARLPEEPRVELVVARPAAREDLDRHGTRRVASVAR
jgi:hypothetical protein